MHMQNSPKTMQVNPSYEKGVVTEIIRFFQEKVNELLKKGIEKDKIILDPGIGFGKSVEDNLDIIRNIETFKALGFPLLFGISRKSFMGKILNKKPKDLLPSTLVLDMLLTIKHIDIIRAHDIEEHRDLIELIRKIYP